MLFLIFKVLGLLLFTALFSALLTWVMIRNKYTEVTETYRSWSEMDDRLKGFDAKLSALGAPDLSGVLSRLDAVDKRVAGIQFPATDLDPVHNRIAALSNQIAPTDLTPVLQRLAALEKQVAGIRPTTVDLAPLQAQVRTVEEKVDAIEIPSTAGVTSGIAALSSTVAALRSPNLEPLEQRLAAVDDKVSKLHNTPGCDLEPMHAHLRQVESKLEGLNSGDDGDKVAMERLHAHMRLLETRIGELKDGNDLTGVTSGIAALSSSVSAIQSPNLAPVEKRLAVVDEKVSKLRNSEPVDLSGFNAINLRLDKIEGLIQQPAAPAKPVFDDLTKVEGIGPKIKELLWADGITSFANLADASNDRLQGILDKAGPRYRVHNPKTWPAQSAMARDDRWDDLKKWQDELDGGR